MDVKEYTGNSYLCLNHLCNQDCIFCIDDPTNRFGENAQLSFEEVKDFILNNHNYSELLALNGGEPTIHPNILEIIDFSSRYYDIVALSTNAIKLSDINFAENIFKAGVNRIGIPIYSSNSKTHDSIVKRDGAFNLLYNALRNIFLLKKKYNVYIHIKLLLSKLNYNDNPGIIDFLIQEKFFPDQISFNGLRTGSKVLENKNTTFISFKESRDEINSTIEKVLKMNCAFFIHEIPLCVLNHKNLLEFVIKGSSISNETFVVLKPNYKECISCTDKLIFPFCEDCIVFDLCDKIFKYNSEKFDYSGLCPVESL